MNKCVKGEPGPHHFVIATAGGPTSPGQCRNCGWGKDFANHSPVPNWASEDQQVKAKISSKIARSKRAREEREALKFLGGVVDGAT